MPADLDHVGQAVIGARREIDLLSIAAGELFAVFLRGVREEGRGTQTLRWRVRIR